MLVGYVINKYILKKRLEQTKKQINERKNRYCGFFFLCAGFKEPENTRTALAFRSQGK